MSQETSLELCNALIEGACASDSCWDTQEIGKLVSLISKKSGHPLATLLERTCPSVQSNAAFWEALAGGTELDDILTLAESSELVFEFVSRGMLDMRRKKTCRKVFEKLAQYIDSESLGTTVVRLCELSGTIAPLISILKQAKRRLMEDGLADEAEWKDFLQDVFSRIDPTDYDMDADLPLRDAFPEIDPAWLRREQCSSEDSDGNLRGLIASEDSDEGMTPSDSSPEIQRRRKKRKRSPMVQVEDPMPLAKKKKKKKRRRLKKIGT